MRVRLHCLCVHARTSTYGGRRPNPLLPVLHAVLLTRLCLTLSWNALQPQL
jgi:hypothetical protein